MKEKMLEFNMRELLYKLPVIALACVFLYLSSGLTRLVMAGLFVMGIISIFIKIKYRMYAVLAAMLIFIPLNIYADMQKSEDLFFYHPYNQSLYQDEFREYGLYPDAYVRELIRDKKVVIPHDVKLYREYIGEKSEEDRAEKFSNKYYRENNYVRYFKEYAHEYEIAKTDPGNDGIKQYAADTGEFDDFGAANDMLRYSFLINTETEKEMSYFWYSWFYYSFSTAKGYTTDVFIQRGLEDADVCYAVWDGRENLYLMDLEHYDAYRKFSAEFRENLENSR